MNVSDIAITVDLLASAPRDEAGLLAFVDRHRVAGLATEVLQGRAANPEFTSALQARQRRAAVRALRHAAATVRVIQMLQAAGIESIPLKGAVLADQLYGDPAIRDVRDADLLLRPHHLGQADALLLESGYQRTWPARLPQPESRQYQQLLEHGYHFEYTHPAEQTNIEIHWRFPNWPDAGVEAIWDSTETRVWRGTPVRMLADDALLLLLLCDHGARHRWFLLKWLVDVATLLPRISNTDSLLRLAKHHDLERPLGQAVILCNRMFGTAITRELRAITATPECRWLAAEALPFLEAPSQYYFAAGRSLRRQLRNRRYESCLRTQPTAWQFSARLDDILAIPLPGRWFWLYYPMRPLLWLHRRFLV